MLEIIYSHHEMNGQILLKILPSILFLLQCLQFCLNDITFKLLKWKRKQCYILLCHAVRSDLYCKKSMVVDDNHQFCIFVEFKRPFQQEVKAIIGLSMKTTKMSLKMYELTCCSVSFQPVVYNKNNIDAIGYLANVYLFVAKSLNVFWLYVQCTTAMQYGGFSPLKIIHGAHKIKIIYHPKVG